MDRRLYYFQTDYIFASKGGVWRFWNIGFWWPQYHDSDRHAVIVIICAGRRRLKEYRRQRQEFPMQLPPHELWNDLTNTFEALKDACEEPETKKRHWYNWVSKHTWLLIKQHTYLRQAGQLCWCKSQHMQHTIHAALKKDPIARTAQAGKSIVAKLAGCNVHEAFSHLKGWNRLATKTWAQPCFQTMERQTMERVDLYQWCDSPGPPIIVVGLLTVAVWDDTSIDGRYRSWSPS